VLPIKGFRGAVVTVSHHESFVAALATEKWLVKDGTLKEVITLAKSKNDLPDFVADKK
jgi:ATPase subunit of ABC transporter with duplicated ATPase domains